MKAVEARTLQVGDWVTASFGTHWKACEITHINWPTFTLQTRDARGDEMIRTRRYASIYAKCAPNRPPTTTAPAWLSWPTPPLFIPLRAEYYDAFCAGTKTDEFRIYGPRWNERTCKVGRRVTLSKGYGTKHRRSGTIIAFTKSWEPCKSDAWRDCYGGSDVGPAACISINLD